MESFYDRLIKEKEELDSRVDKLEAFLLSEGTLLLSSEEYSLLEIQHWIMKAYSSTLDRRIKLAITKES